ncbi:MAG: hypothetical protein DRO99_01355 [Candidatus Aenigmatarchaeota archaeon]|nr:MAG: hypothetical protein DRO99_01355 [Candidatus Aenigmarchaeota archaeon]
MIDGQTVNYEQNGKKCITRIICFACNNNCVSCVTNYDKADKEMFLSFEDIKDIIDDFDPETKTIDYNGGEPTMRKDLLKILQYTRMKFPGAHIQLLTNGRMFSYNKYADMFANANLGSFRLFITIYGPNERVHDGITRTPGSFKQTMKGIRNMLDRGFDIEVRVIITKMNYKHFPEIAQFVCGIPGINRIVFIAAKIIGEAYRNRDAVLVGFDEMRDYVNRASEILIGHKGEKEIRLFHFPFCTIDSKYWDMIEGVTVPEVDITFGPECEKCSKRTTCPGIWASYADLRGFGEFRPIS